MTEQELNSGHDLKKQIRDLEKHLQTLRLSAENLVPILDGLPHSNEAKSRGEKIALLSIRIHLRWQLQFRRIPDTCRDC